MRFLRVFLTTALCMVLFYIMGAFFNVPSQIENPARFLGSIIFAALFLAPFSIGALLIVALIMYYLDMRGRNRIWLYIVIWSVPGLLLSFVALHALPVAMVTGAVYWALTGRVAGTPEIGIKNFRTQNPLKQVFVSVLACYLVFLIGDFLVISGKRVWAGSMEPSLGTPEYAFRFERQMTADMKLALLKFPSPESCVADDVALVEPNTLVKINWDTIETYNEANICVFRLLSTYGDISKSGEWFEGQGLRNARDGYNAENPYVERDGSLRVAAYWSIKDEGPLFPASGTFRYIVASIPYSMTINATWTEDGETLKWIEIGANTL